MPDRVGTARPMALSNSHWMDRCSCCSRDAVRSDAMIDDGVIVTPDDVIDHGGLVVNLGCLMVRHTMPVVMMAMEIIVGHECEAAPRQAEGEARPARAAII